MPYLEVTSHKKAFKKETDKRKKMHGNEQSNNNFNRKNAAYDLMNKYVQKQHCHTM